MKDRFNIDTNNREIIKKMNDCLYIGKISPADVTTKEVFMYAMALGSECPTNIEGRKESYFHDKDLLTEDIAVMYALVYDNLESIEDVTNNDIVYEQLEKMANTGFKVIQEEMKDGSIDNLERRLLLKLDEKYKEIFGDQDYQLESEGI